MTEWPSWLAILVGAIFGAFLRAFLGRAAKRLSRGEFLQLAAIETLGAFLFGLAAGWLLAHPEAAPWPDPATQWAFVGFIALGPNLRDPAEESPFFRLILALGGALAGVFIGLRGIG